MKKKKTVRHNERRAQKVKEQKSGITGGEMDEELEEGKKPKRAEMEQEMDQVEQLVIKGFSLDQIKQVLGLSRRTLERRIAERREENLAKAKDLKGRTRDQQMADMLAEYTLMKRTLWTAVSDASKQADKISAVDKINDVDTKQIKVMQMLGYLPKDSSLFEDARPMVVLFKGMSRPDRSKQIKKSTNAQSGQKA